MRTTVLISIVAAAAACAANAAPARAATRCGRTELARRPNRGLVLSVSASRVPCGEGYRVIRDLFGGKGHTIPGLAEYQNPHAVDGWRCGFGGGGGGCGRGGAGIGWYYDGQAYRFLGGVLCVGLDFPSSVTCRVKRGARDVTMRRTGRAHVRSRARFPWRKFGRNAYPARQNRWYAVADNYQFGFNGRIECRTFTQHRPLFRYVSCQNAKGFPGQFQLANPYGILGVNGH